MRGDTNTGSKIYRKQLDFQTVIKSSEIGIHSCSTTSRHPTKIKHGVFKTATTTCESRMRIGTIGPYDDMMAGKKYVRRARIHIFCNRTRTHRLQCGEFYQRENGDADNPQRWDLPLLEDDQVYSINGLDSCQYLEHGKCWWFAIGDQEISPRPGSQAYTSFSEVVRTKRFTSITKKGEANDEDDADGGGGANKIFLSQAKFGAYPNQHTDVAQNEEKLHDFVIATPTLEVGVDMDNVSEVLTHKAIRNISSYRQKVGRAGREIGSDALTVTLASNRRRISNIIDQ